MSKSRSEDHHDHAAPVFVRELGQYGDVLIGDTVLIAFEASEGPFGPWNDMDQLVWDTCQTHYAQRRSLKVDLGNSVRYENGVCIVAWYSPSRGNNYDWVELLNVPDSNGRRVPMLVNSVRQESVGAGVHRFYDVDGVTKVVDLQYDVTNYTDGVWFDLYYHSFTTSSVAKKAPGTR